MKNYSLLDEVGKLLEIIPETMDVEVPVLDEDGQPTAVTESRKVPLKERYHPDFIAKLVPYRSSHSEPWAPPSTPTPAPGSTFVAPPSVVTMRQARLALIEVEKYSSVLEVIESADERARVEWEFAATVDRASSLVAQIASVLGLNEADLDELFTLAATL